VQVSTNLTAWENFGAPRAATGDHDTVSLDSSQPAAFYRVIQLR
jgi:hypothetical protein